MIDRYKGFLVHLDYDLRADDCQDIITALKNIKHIANVEPLTTNINDHIHYLRGKREVIEMISDCIGDTIMKKQ